MQARDLDTKPANTAWIAAMDADRYSRECRDRYTPREQATAETFRDLMNLAYAGAVYINYRKTFVTVKVNQPVVRDRGFLRGLEELCAERKYDKIRTAQGISYRLKFAS